MTIQLHLSHTLVECETRFMRLGSYRPPYDADFSAQRKIVTLLSDHPNGDIQLLNLGTVSFTHSQWRGVFTNKNNISILISGLCD